MNANDRSTERSYDAISTNNEDINNSTEKISNQKQNVERNADDPNALKGSKKTLSNLANEKKTLQRHNEAQGKKIDNRDKENRGEYRNMESSQDNQAVSLVALERQKQIVRDVQFKLDNIK